jgi:hypothetical protein
LIAVQHEIRTDSRTFQKTLFAARMSRNGPAHILVMR